MMGDPTIYLGKEKVFLEWKVVDRRGKRIFEQRPSLFLGCISPGSGIDSDSSEHLCPTRRGRDKTSNH